MKLPAWRAWWRVAAAAFLAAWAAGLVFAGVQLSAWNEELVRTLLQIRADTVFRLRMGQAHETIPREWYLSKAAALLAASDKLQDDGRWMLLLLPGSWRPFDDLRERLATRIERAFSETAVETMRRELFYRAGRLTGVAQDPGTAELLMGAGCAQPPVPLGLDAAGNAGMRELPEYIAVQSHLEAVEQLDQAVRAMLALQDAETADAKHLRELVRYTLGTDLPGRLSRSAALFRTGATPGEPAFGAQALGRVQYAARCSLGKAMAALDTRFFERNDMLAAESYLAQRWARLLAPGARPLPYGETVQGLREIVAALNEEEALLAHGDYAWLYQATPSLGAAHEALLAQAAAMRLLGPEAVDQVRRQSGRALQQFRAQFTRTFDPSGTAEPAVTWEREGRRLVLSPQRLALRDGIIRLLGEPFMAEPAARAIPASAPVPLVWDTQRLERALSLGEVRRRFMADKLPAFPPAARAGIAQLVNGQFAQLVQDGAVEAIVAPVASEPPAAADAVGYRTQRELLAKVQSLLAAMGARSRAEQLGALVSRDLVERLALAEQGVWRSPLFSARTQDFSWWQGEGSPVLQAFGVADALTLKYLLAQIDEPVRQASGSLQALERYLVSLADMSRANCAEKLSAAAVPGDGADAFARRHAHIHRALAARCAQLRSGRP